MTIGDLKKAAVEKLRMKGGQSADLDVELLLAFVFGMEREMILTHLADQVFPWKNQNKQPAAHYAPPVIMF